MVDFRGTALPMELMLWHPPPPARVRLPIVNPPNTHGAALSV
eukprot:COSAG01_NODE_22000_length_876_cov_1.756757_1_plen_41_part_10